MAAHQMTAADRFCLAIDLGTGGPKVGLVSMTGAIAWKEHTPVETGRTAGGGAVQDASAWWEVISDSSRRALSSGVIDPERLVTVTITGQWASTVPVDTVGHPVGDCLLWQDTRGAPYALRVIGGPVAGHAPVRALRWVRRSGGAPSLRGADPIGHMLFIEHRQPEVARAARWYLEPVDYLAMRLTGRAAASPASMTGAWLTDNRTPERLRYDPALVSMAGIDATKLPPLCPTGSIVGTVTVPVARDLGLPPGVTVVTGTPDLHSAACGAGAVLPYQAHLALSTSSWIGAPVPFKKTDIRRQIASVPGLDPASYLIADNHETGGLCLQWLRDLLFPGESFEALTDLAATAAPGAGSLLFTPWLNGERSPVEDHLARGGFHNLSLHTTRADLVRAVLEGVAYNSRWLHQAVERFTGRPLDPLRIIGGGALSDLWCQVHADVLDRIIERPAEPLHANLRGAAIFAGLSLGHLRPSDVASLVPAERTFTPDPAMRRIYDRLFAEFPKLYSSQRKLFARLNRT